MLNTSTDAERRLDAVQRRARRHLTPCHGSDMVWHVWGNGKPVVLLHGAQGFWAHWYHTIDALAATRSVWVPDLPGMGESGDPDGEDHAALVLPLAEGLDRLLSDAGPLDVVGFSMGGVIATHLASLRPDLVGRLVIIDPGGLDTPLGDIRLHRLKGVTGEAREAALRGNMLSIMLHHPESADDLAMAIYRRGMDQSRFNPAPLIMPDHLVTALAKARAPLDAIWGALDGPHPDPALQEAALRRLRPDMRFRVVPDAGHWCMYERPEAFNAALRELLELPPPSPG